MTFYSTAAQIIPIIFLALAFEFRGEGFRFLPAGLSTDDDPKFEAAYSLFLASALAAGEATALLVLVGHEPSQFTKWLVGTALTVGGLGVLIPVVMMQLLAIFPGLKRFPAKRVAANFFAYAFGLLVVSSLVAAAVFAKATGCQPSQSAQRQVAQLLTAANMLDTAPRDSFTELLLAAEGMPASVCVEGSNSLALCSFETPVQGETWWCVGREGPNKGRARLVDPAIPDGRCLY